MEVPAVNTPECVQGVVREAKDRRHPCLFRRGVRELLRIGTPSRRGSQILASHPALQRVLPWRNVHLCASRLVSYETRFVLASLPSRFVTSPPAATRTAESGLLTCEDVQLDSLPTMIAIDDRSDARRVVSNDVDHGMNGAVTHGHCDEDVATSDHSAGRFSRVIP